MKFTPNDIELFALVSGRERLEERRKFIQELVESAYKGAQNQLITKLFSGVNKTNAIEKLIKFEIL